MGRGKTTSYSCTLSQSTTRKTQDYQLRSIQYVINSINSTFYFIKKTKMSAPPMENQQIQQMPAAPPSYDQVVGADGGGIGGGGMYPPLPEKGGPPPAAYVPPQAAPYSTSSDPGPVRTGSLLRLQASQHDVSPLSE